jgi:hypothetical protein
MVMGELSQDADLLVIGSGPGGYAAAFRAADLGLDVTLVDTAPRPGGVCLYRGCIPSRPSVSLELIFDAARATSMGVIRSSRVDGEPAALEGGGDERWPVPDEPDQTPRGSARGRAEFDSPRACGCTTPRSAASASGMPSSPAAPVPLSRHGVQRRHRVMSSTGAPRLRTYRFRCPSWGGMSGPSGYVRRPRQPGESRDCRPAPAGCGCDLVEPLQQRLKTIFPTSG